MDLYFPKGFLSWLIFGGWGHLVPQVSCLSNIGLHRRLISSEGQETLRAWLGGSYNRVIYIYIYIYIYLYYIYIYIIYIYIFILYIHIYIHTKQKRKITNPDKYRYKSLLFMLPLDVDLVFLDNKKCIFNSKDLYSG